MATIDKNLLPQVSNNPKVKELLNKHIIWEVTSGNWKKIFVGSLEECEAEYDAEGYDYANRRICQNEIVDCYEGSIEGIVYMTFSSGDFLEIVK
jgi:hypothetical protein